MQTITSKTAEALKSIDDQAADIATQRKVYTDAIARAQGLRAESTGLVADLTTKRKNAAAAWFLGLTKRTPVDAIEAEAKKAQQDRERARLDAEIANMGEAGLSDLVQPLVADRLRTSDHVGRIGGEEFLIVLPETEGREALSVAEELRTLTDAAGHRLHAAIKNLGEAYAEVAALGAALQQLPGAQSMGPIHVRNFDLPVPYMLQAFAGGPGRQQVVFGPQYRETGLEIFIDAAGIERDIAAQLRASGIHA